MGGAPALPGGRTLSAPGQGGAGTLSPYGAVSSSPHGLPTSRVTAQIQPPAPHRPPPQSGHLCRRRTGHR